MPSLAAISTIDFPYKVEQQMVKEGARNLFAPSYPQVERMMSDFVFGLGGGVSGYSKANILAIANPDAVDLLVTVELCSLTFLRNDFSKSNFIGASLSDGIAACIITGDNHQKTTTS